WWDVVRYTIERSRRAHCSVVLFPNEAEETFPLATAENRRHASAAIIDAMKRVSNDHRVRFIEDLPRRLGVALPTAPPPNIAPLDWSEIQFLAGHGVEFGGHTETHPILSRLDQAEVTGE